MATNKPGPESVLPDSLPLALGAVVRGLPRLRPNPLMDSTDTTPMLMVSTVPMESPLHTKRSPQGLRGKRSADEAKVFGTGHNSYLGQTVWGFPSKAKRSAEAEPEAEAEAEAAPYYYGYYGHQLNWPSYYAPGFSSTVWGARGKRSAEPAYGYYGYPYGYYGYRYGPGIAGHPSGTSYTFRSPQGLGK